MEGVVGFCDISRHVFLQDAMYKVSTASAAAGCGNDDAPTPSDVSATTAHVRATGGNVATTTGAAGDADGTFLGPETRFRKTRGVVIQLFSVGVFCDSL